MSLQEDQQRLKGLVLHDGLVQGILGRLRQAQRVQAGGVGHNGGDDIQPKGVQKRLGGYRTNPLDGGQELLHLLQCARHNPLRQIYLPFRPINFIFNAIRAYM